jgi:hypothetical protein
LKKENTSEKEFEKDDNSPRNKLENQQFFYNFQKNNDKKKLDQVLIKNDFNNRIIEILILTMI